MTIFRIHGDVELETTGLTKYGSPTFHTKNGLVSIEELVELGLTVEAIDPDKEIKRIIKGSFSSENVLENLRSAGYVITKVDNS